MVWSLGQLAYCTVITSAYYKIWMLCLLPSGTFAEDITFFFLKTATNTLRTRQASDYEINDSIIFEILQSGNEQLK